MFPEMERRGNECYRTRMSDAHYTGGCLCGAVRYRAARHRPRPVLLPLRVLPARGRLARRAVGHLRARALPAAAGRAHRVPLLRPSVCAASAPPAAPRLTYRSENRPTEIDVTLGTLDEPTRLAPQMHVWVEDKLPWVMIADGLPQWPRGAGHSLKAAALPGLSAPAPAASP